MFCPNCGNKMNDNAVFCSNCGFKNEKSKKVLFIPNISVPNIKKFIPAIIGVVAVILLVFVVKGVVSGRHCKYDGCEDKIYKEGYCQKHYAKIVTEKNIDDVISGEKNWKDAAKDTYDKSFSNEQKKQIEDNLNEIKNSFGNLFGN